MAWNYRSLGYLIPPRYAGIDVIVRLSTARSYGRMLFQMGEEKTRKRYRIPQIGAIILTISEAIIIYAGMLVNKRRGRKRI